MKTAKKPTRLHLGFHHTAAPWVKSRMVQSKLDLDPEQFEVSPPRHVKEVKARAGGNVGAPFKDDLARCAGPDRQRYEYGLQDQPGRTCGPDVEPIFSWSDRAGLENQLRAVQASPLDMGFADGRGGADAGQVLRLQPRLAPAAAYVTQVEGTAGDQRQGQARAQNLPTAFAE